MPSITGGSSTSIDYAPHMYVLREGGSSHRDDDYIFVGNAETSYEDVAQYGTTYAEQLATITKLATAVYCNDYHIGVSAIEGLVGDKRVKKREVVGIDGKNYLTSSVVHGSHQGIPASEIPETAKKKLIKAGLEQIATLAGHTILGGLGIEIPTDLEPLDFGKVFNGTPEEQSTEQTKRDQWQVVAGELRHTFGIE